MKYRNNIIHFIRKEFEIKEKENNWKKQKDKLKKNYNAYKIDLENLKTICKNKGVDTPEKLDYFIEQVEKEILSKEKSDEKMVKTIGSVIALVGTPFISLLFDWAKTDINSMILVVLFLAEVIIMFYAIHLIVDEINSHFSLNVQYKKLLNMLRDIKLLYCSEERRIDE